MTKAPVEHTSLSTSTRDKTSPHRRMRNPEKAILISIIGRYNTCLPENSDRVYCIAQEKMGSSKVEESITDEGQ